MKLAPLPFGLATLIFTAASPAHTAGGKLKVVTTFTIIADMILHGTCSSFMHRSGILAASQNKNTGHRQMAANP